MPNNGFLPFATGAGANVLTDQGYAASPEIAQGVQDGVADPQAANKAWRQSSVMASAIGQFIADFAQVDTADSQAVAVIEANFRVALAAALDGARYGIDTSSTANLLVATLTPSPPTLNSFTAIYVKVANTNTGPTLLNLNNLGSKSVVLPDGTQLSGGEMIQGRIYSLLFDGVRFQLQNAFQNLTTVINNTYAKGSLIARRVFSTPGTQTYTPTAGTNRVRVTVVAGGGAGGATQATGSGQFSVAGGGGGGGVAVSDLSSGFSGVTLTIGAGGAPSSTGTAPGGNGGSSSFGSMLASTGGLGGTTTVPNSGPVVQAGGAGGVGTGGNVFNGVGGAGANGVGTNNGNAASGNGGASYFGSGASAQFTTTAGGLSASTPGTGGSGAVSLSSQAAQAGGAGAPGTIIVEEYA